jgi:hypothetical protein
MTQEEFDELARELENDTRYYSGFYEIENHSNFIHMQTLRLEILPYLVNKLNTDPHWWLFLLFDKIITNKPKIPKESCGVFKDIIQIYKNYFNTNFILMKPLKDKL